MSKEYNFEMDDSGAATVNSTATVVSSSASSNILGLLADKRKLILIAVGVLVGIAVIFKVFQWLLTPSTPAPKSAPMVQMAQPAMPQTEEPAVNNVLNARINTLESRLQDSTAQIGDMQKKMTQTEATLTDIQTQLVTMHQLMDATAQRLQDLMKEMQPKKIEAPRYYIQAMVAGRAWLVNAKGAVTTVSVGDEIAGIGTITAIDIQQGTVTTNQGQVIRYHPEDR